MSFQTIGIDVERVYKSLQSGLLRNTESNTRASIPSEQPWTPRLHMHVTRVLGKLCFSCRSVNALNDKFCSECGAPLFRPADSQMYRTAQG